MHDLLKKSSYFKFYYVFLITYHKLYTVRLLFSIHQGILLIMVKSWINKVIPIISLKTNISQKIFNILLSDLASLFMRINLLWLAQITSPRIAKHRITNVLSSIDYSRQSLNIPGLKNRRIVLIGPGFSGTNSTILNQFEIIARIGFTGEGSSAPGISKRCDLSFLAKWHAESLATAADINHENLKRTHFLVREDVTSDVVERLRGNFCVSQISTTPSNEIFGRVTPNFAPQIIMWLLLQDPSELHITHIDLFTDSRRPPKYATNKNVVFEKENYRHTNQQMQKSFSLHHNPFSHFTFFRSLRNVRAISYSENLNLIIDRGLSNYRKTLRDIYY